MSVSNTPVSNVTGYINYFRQLAVSHKDLQHNPDSETGNGTDGSMHFMKISAEEVLSAINRVIGFPCMTLELYETEAEAQTTINIKLLPKGAFMIIDNPADQSFPAQEACYAATEKIVFDLLKQIYQHHYAPGVDECKAPFKTFSYDKLSITPVGPVFANQYGYRVVFDFEMQDTIDLTEAPEPGTFL